jgi:hypothetical protein
MGARRKITFQGQEVWAEEIDFEVEKEPWNSYILHDGTQLRMKTVVSEVARLEGMFNQDGDPIYLVKTSNVVSAVVPENLKKRG